MEVYLVGGAVRDELLGLPVSERDWVVVGSSVNEMLSLGYLQVGKDFPVFLHPETKEEYALARTERKKGRGYHGFEVHASPEVTLEEDLLRRDLTINAIAKSMDGTLIDPYNGQVDLEHKVLRHISDAFSEDPLRVLRVARFAAKYFSLGFSIDESTLACMSQIVSSDELQEISRERIWQETSKALQSNTASEFFDVLHNIDALQQVYPYFSELYASSENHAWGLSALDAVSKNYADESMRFAALIGGLHYRNAETYVENIEKFNNQFPLPNLVKKLLHGVTHFQHSCHHAQQLSAEECLHLLQFLDARRNPERFEMMLNICEAIYTSVNNHEEYPQKKFLLDAAKALENIDMQAIAKQASESEQIGEQIKLSQLATLKELIQTYK